MKRRLRRVKYDSFKSSDKSKDILFAMLKECDGDTSLINAVLKHSKYADGVEFSLQDISDILGVSRERVRQIEATALNKIFSKKRVELIDLKDTINEIDREKGLKENILICMTNLPPRTKNEE